MAEIHWRFENHTQAADIICDPEFKYVIISEEEKSFIRQNIMP